MVTDPQDLMWAIVYDSTALNPGLCKIHITDTIAYNDALKTVYDREPMLSLLCAGPMFEDVTGNNNIFCHICDRKWYELLEARQFEL